MSVYENECLKPIVTRRKIEFALRNPHLAFLSLSGRLSYEGLLRALVSKDLEFLRSRASHVLKVKDFLQLSKEELDKTLRLIAPANDRTSWRLLNRWYSFLYAVTRATLPTTVVETGVLYGHSSAAILAGLEDNGAGTLFSIDLPPEEHRSIRVGQQYTQVGLRSPALSVGCGVPFLLRSRWNLRLGNSLELLPRIFDQASPISMFIHDSLHTYDHMTREYCLAYEVLEPGGLLISDDVSYNSAWSDFCKSKKENWTDISKGADDNGLFAFLVK